MSEKPSEQLCLGILGSPDFCRRINGLAQTNRLSVASFGASFPEAWSLISSNRPNILIIEIGFQHSEKTHIFLRRLLEQIRDRLGSEIYICLALMASDKLFYGGDLLFGQDLKLAASGLIDTFIALPPTSIPSIPNLPDQVANVISLQRAQPERIATGRSALPALNTEGWVQSLADPVSRKLWMTWLPRFASYTNENPIIVGETGTGKTNLAYALHMLSGRTGQFIGITPRDFSSSELVQAELFGAVAGAYTGAVDKWGLVKGAEKGTLFIDELQSIDKDLQGKLITFIENKTYRRVGSTERIGADVRFVFASNRTLPNLIQAEILRHDFAYRLERMQLELLPLRSRRLDVTAALAYSLAKIHRQRPHTKAIFGLNSTAYRLLFGYDWPGNLRQLENCVAQLCEVTDMEGYNVIDEKAVSQVFQTSSLGMASSAPEVFSRAAQRLSESALADDLTSLDSSVRRFIEISRLTALEACGGDIELASQMISDDKSSLRLLANRLKNLG